MAKQIRTKKAGEKPTRKRVSKKGLTTEELMRKHMSDPNHNITEEDLKNVKIDLHVAPDEPLKLKPDDERPHDIDKDHKMTTPWDVIKDS